MKIFLSYRFSVLSGGTLKSNSFVSDCNAYALVSWNDIISWGIVACVLDFILLIILIPASYMAINTTLLSVLTQAWRDNIKDIYALQ